MTLIGKSLGTVAMGHLLAARRPGPTQLVWLTPLLHDPQLVTRIEHARQRTLFVIGTADAYYDPDLLARLQEATGGDCLAVEGADHGLEIPGDVAGSVRALEAVMLRLQDFIR